MKTIYAEDLIRSIANDPEINGRNFAKVKRHIDDAPAAEVVQEDCKACAEATTNCIAELQEQIAELRSMQKWIPVTERLPERNDDVLCYRGNHIGVLMDVYTYIGDDKWDDTYGNRIYTDDEGITHWMPLPEPPKEGDQK